MLPNVYLHYGEDECVAGIAQCGAHPSPCALNSGPLSGESSAQIRNHSCLLEAERQGGSRG
jgi:hypothetical protein